MDTRTDIWAFGCVLYELLTGRMAFMGGTVTDVLAAVIRQEPDWAALPPATPPSVLRLLRRCLYKDPKRRLRHIGDARLELEESHQELPVVDRAPRRRAISASVPWLAAAIATAIALRFALRTAPVATEHGEFASVRAER